MNALPTLWRDAAQEEPDLWLFAVLGRGAEEGSLSPQRMETLEKEFAERASRRMRAWVMKVPFAEGRRLALREVVERVSLGLEALSGADARRAVALLGGTTLARLEAEGDALVARLRQRAEEVRAALQWRDLLPWGETEELEFFNGAEAIFFDGLARGVLTVREVAPLLKEVSPPRPIRSLRDVQLAERMLDVFEGRAEVFHAIPREAFWTSPQELDALGDRGRVLITCLFVRLAVTGSKDLRFDLSAEALRRFREIGGTEEVRARLRRWIETFVEAHISSARAGDARAYLLACLEGIEEMLPHLEEGESAPTGRC